MHVSCLRKRSGVRAAITHRAGRNALFIATDSCGLIHRKGDRAVLAYLGSSDFLGSGGMVDMVRAPLVGLGAKALHLRARLR
jgi:hypothetical protein